MTDYKKYINALRKCAKEHENDRLFTGHVIVSDLCRDTAKLLESIEREKIAEQLKKGHWITENMSDGDVGYRCSVCKELFWLECGTPKDNKYNFCPKCGERLIEAQESEEKE